MPNIEIHGYMGVNWSEGVRLRENILNLLKGSCFQDEAVVSLFNDFCVDVGGESQPFLRICSSNHGHIPRLLEILEPIDMDKEVLELMKFVPKKGKNNG